MHDRPTGHRIANLHCGFVKSFEWLGKSLVQGRKSLPNQTTTLAHPDAEAIIKNTSFRTPKMVAAKMKPTSVFKSLTLYHASLSGCSAHRGTSEIHPSNLPYHQHLHIRTTISLLRDHQPKRERSLPSRWTLAFFANFLERVLDYHAVPAILDFLDCHFPQPALLPGWKPRSTERGSWN